MKQHLTASQTQQLALTPQLRQALAILQMSATELEAEIAEALESNPLLEWQENAGSGDEIAQEAQGSGTSEENTQEREHGDDWEGEEDTSWKESDDWPERSGNHADGEMDDPAARQAAPESLQEHLLWQLNLSHLGPRDLQIGATLINAIDNDGYLREPLVALAEAMPSEWQLSETDILPLLRLVQHFDPIACGSRNLGECLTIQLQQLPADTPALALALAIAETAIERLPRIGIPGIMREFACTEAEAEAALALIRSLDPRPGSRVGDIAHDAYVTPDAVIWRQKGVWQVALTRNARPPLDINREYAQMAASASGSDGQYLRGCLQEARWLLKNIEQRGETLLRILQCLIREQAGFLEFGQSALRPLTLREVAQHLELHESTISRAIARKYVRTPRGTLALREFFAQGIDHDGVAASSTAIQAMIREMIDNEDGRKPLSDAAIASRLEQSGIPVARRTVAKYREALGIASSQERVRL